MEEPSHRIGHAEFLRAKQKFHTKINRKLAELGEEAISIDGPIRKAFCEYGLMPCALESEHRSLQIMKAMLIEFGRSS